MFLIDLIQKLRQYSQNTKAEKKIAEDLYKASIKEKEELKMKCDGYEITLSEQNTRIDHLQRELTEKMIQSSTTGDNLASDHSLLLEKDEMIKSLLIEKEEYVNQINQLQNKLTSEFL